MKVCRLCSSAGFPATQRNCFSSVPPIRVLLPPATITTPTSRVTEGAVTPCSREQPPQRVLNRSHADKLEVARHPLRHPALREIDALDAHVRRLGDTSIGLRDRSNLAAEPKLADERG